MKLYYAPGACSLADHIALHEAGLSFDREKVDLKAKRTESGADYRQINPKGYVPALTLDEGGTLTENIAILDWVADQSPDLRPKDRLAHARLLEMLAYISTELHKSFKPFFAGASDEEKAAAGERITMRLELLAEQIGDDGYLFGDRFGVADAYLFVMLMWARNNQVARPGALDAYYDRVKGREAVATALAHEGLTRA